MMKNVSMVSLVFVILMCSTIILSFNVTACKDIIACGDATDGDYNLLLKVRDPSRSGFQVLSIVPKGYEYTYHHPWTGNSINFTVRHKFIGVATIYDTIPNIVKNGMSFSDSGLAFGDADTDSIWKNPTKNAWDDFDWMRYACQQADDEDEAVELMTKVLVDELHASKISENLFLIGPKKGFVIEADAFHYKVKEITDGVIAMSTYPKELWRTQYIKTLPIAASFDTTKEEYVKVGNTLSLNSLYRIKIIDVGEDWISARQIPLFKITKYGIIFHKPVKIELGSRATVGDFSLRLLEISEGNAKISLCYKYKAWEDIMMNNLQKDYGSITIKNMIKWSRLHEEDLEGLRPMCEDRSTYEASLIFKIPKLNYENLSSGWFAANHPCISIYVPVHICDTDIYDPFENGDAAALSMELLKQYGHDNLSSYFTKVEDVLLYEVDIREQIASNMIENDMDVSEFLTYIDMGMQKQAWLTEQIWLEISKISNEENKQEIIEQIGNIWEKNYSVSLEKMRNAIYILENIPQTESIIEKIEEIMIIIEELKITQA